MKPERWQQIKGLYESALRCNEGGRASFLDQACAGDPSLRREVESLLAYENRDDGFIETPALEVAARALAGEKAESLVGRQLGSYKILSFLGAGGMGEVYRARDTKLEREVALKVLPEVFARDAERLGRFRREALLLAALNHPNIAAIYGLEESEGLCYLVLELVPGKTLAEWIEAGPLDVREALRICGQIAEGLEAAHDRGIVHRDLKPANIKVTAEGKVKVLDFGLAKSVAGEGRDFSHSPTATKGGTAKGVILGTPAYMSPEQARGQPLNKRTDIWSFGCVLYELLTGQKTFAADTLSDTIVRILGQEPDWTMLPATTPASIRMLLRRCLEKDSRRRLHDISDARIEIEDEFSALAAAESPGVAPSRRASAAWRALRLERKLSGENQTLRTPRRKKVAVIALVSLLLLVIAGTFFNAIRFARIGSRPAIKSIAVLPFVNANSDADAEVLCDGITDNIIDRLSQLPDLRVISHRAVFRYKGRDTDPQAIGTELGVEALLSGRVSRRGDEISVNVELVDAKDKSRV